MTHKIFKSLLFLAFTLLLSINASADDKPLDQVLFENSEYLRLGQPKEALSLLVSHQENYGHRQEFLNNLAITYLGNNEPEKALSILRTLVDEDPLFSIIAHNLLEMELGPDNAENGQVNPILFVQSVDSFLAGTPIPTGSNPPLIKQDTPVHDNSDVLLNNALRSLIQSWAKAWSDKNFERYAAHYAASFKPEDGLIYNEWRAQRADRLAKPGEIEVTIDNLKIDTRSSQPRIQFDQSYRSANYRDKTLKEMTFIQDNERWKIASETTIRKYP